MLYYIRIYYITGGVIYYSVVSYNIYHILQYLYTILHYVLYSLCIKLQVSIGQALDISRETYFAILMDREYNGPVMIGSPQGGVDIEQVAKDSPQAIFTEPIDIHKGLTDEQADKMATNLEFTGPAHKQVIEIYLNGRPTSHVFLPKL